MPEQHNRLITTFNFKPFPNNHDLKFFENSEQLIAVLIKLKLEKPSIFIDIVKKSQPYFLENEMYGEYYQLRNSAVLKHSKPEELIRFIINFKDRLPAVIKNGDPITLPTFLARLAPDQHSEIITALKDQLPALIEYNGQLRAVLKKLQPKQCNEIYAAIQDIIVNKIQPVYKALVAGTTSWSACFPVYSLFQIRQSESAEKFVVRFYSYLEKNYGSFATKAWRIYNDTIRQQQSVSCDNANLYKNIYKYCVKQSIFPTSNYNYYHTNPIITDFSQAPENTRRQKIYNAFTTG